MNVRELREALDGLPDYYEVVCSATHRFPVSQAIVTTAFHSPEPTPCVAIDFELED